MLAEFILKIATKTEDTMLDIRQARTGAETEDALFDSEAGGEHGADLYVASHVAERITVEQARTDAARTHYAQHGWLAVRDVLDADEVSVAFAAIDDLVRGRVAGFKGVIYERAVRGRLGQIPEAERRDAVRKLFRFAQFEPRLEILVRQANINAICRNLLGGKTPSLFQDMALLKPPFIGREKPWHQDHAFFNYSLDTKFVGVWIALDRATIQNGCMHVLDRGHLQGPKIHFKRRDVQICDTEMLGQTAVAFPLEPGDAMFFDGLLPHGTPANSSPDRRRALQFHYAPEGAVEGDSSMRLSVFGAEGKDATC